MVNTENPTVNALVTGEQTNQTHGFATPQVFFAGCRVLVAG